MGELVKYHNDINEIPLRNFTDKELNLFFTIIYKAKDENIKKIDLDFLELRKLSNGDTHVDRFVKALDNMDKKLLQLNQSVEIEKGVFKRFNLFNDFTINTNTKKLTITIHEFFSYMLNDLPQYTKFELSQLVNLRSSYSKNMFRLLKQFEGTGKKIIFLEDFKRLLCIPESYKMGNIDQKVLKPIMEELSPIFFNLKLEKIKKGRSIDKLIFTWGNRNILSGEITCKGNSVKSGLMEEVVISEGLNKAIEKVKKNRFIKPLITTQNIEKLLKEFTDQELTKGLYFANTEIKTEIKSINYLIKTINTGIEEKQIKIVVKKSEPNDLQGIELKEEVKEELTEEIREPINQELEGLKKNIEKKLLEKRKKYDKFVFPVILKKIKMSKSLDELNKLIIEYKINK